MALALAGAFACTEDQVLGSFDTPDTADGGDAGHHHDGGGGGGDGGDEVVLRLPSDAGPFECPDGAAMGTVDCALRR